MDLATLLGLVGAMAVIGISDRLRRFSWNLHECAISCRSYRRHFCCDLTRISLADFFGSFKLVLSTLLHKAVSLTKLIEEAVELADVARKEGVLALEGKEISDIRF